MELMIIRALYSPLLTLALSILFVLLNVLDAHSTWSVLRPHHFERERNPIARWVFRKLGLVPGIMVFKSVLIIILAFSIGYYTAYDPFTINLVMLVACGIFTWVVWHNYRIAARIRKSPLHIGKGL